MIEACCKLKCESALIDDEMVVQDEHGITDFHALRSAIYAAPQRIVLFAFDLLHFNGQDLRGCPLLERRALLWKLLKPDPRSPIQFSDHLEGDGARFFKAVADLGLEGIVSHCEFSSSRISCLGCRRPSSVVVSASSLPVKGRDKRAYWVPYTPTSGFDRGKYRYLDGSVLQDARGAGQRVVRVGLPTTLTPRIVEERANLRRAIGSAATLLTGPIGLARWRQDRRA